MRMPTIRSLTLLAVLAVASSSLARLPGLELIEEMCVWRDSMTVAGKHYEIPAIWRGLRLGLDDQPSPPDLLPVPDDLRIPSRTPLLRAGALASFLEMATAAAADGVILRIRSGYRSPEEQTLLVAERIETGRQFAEVIRGVAPPGYSEHMLGTTVDLELGRDYDDNPAYDWLKERAWSFGWRETYPRGARSGFPWEPWHWRWLGDPDLALMTEVIETDCGPDLPRWTLEARILGVRWRMKEEK